MKKLFSISLYVIIIFSLLGCTMDVSQPAMATPSSDVLSPATNNPTPGVNLPWASLHLSGRLIYTAVSKNDNGTTLSMQVLDLTTGEPRTLLTTTSYAWIYYVAVSPDGKQVIMSYVPPSQTGSEAETRTETVTCDKGRARCVRPCRFSPGRSA